MNGSSRGHEVFEYDGLEIVERSRKEFVLRWPAGTARFKGAAKTMIDPFLDALTDLLAARN